MPDVVRVISNGRELLWSGIVSTNGSSPIEFILTGTPEIIIRVTLSVPPDEKNSPWKATPNGNVLEVTLGSERLLTGISVPIKIGRYQKPGDSPPRELWFSIVTTTYGPSPYSALLALASFYLGAPAATDLLP